MSPSDVVKAARFPKKDNTGSYGAALIIAGIVWLMMIAAVGGMLPPGDRPSWYIAFCIVSLGVMVISSAFSVDRFYKRKARELDGRRQAYAASLSECGASGDWSAPPMDREEHKPVNDYEKRRLGRAYFELLCDVVRSDRVITDEESRLVGRELVGLTPSIKDAKDVADMNVRAGTVASMKAMQDGHPVPYENPGIILQKGEQVYAMAGCSLLEERTTTSTSLVGGSLSVPLGKGYSYQMGSYKPVTRSFTSTMIADTGMLLISSTRVVFNGGKKSKSVPFASILSLKMVGNVLVVAEPNSDQALEFFVSDVEYVAYMLTRTMDRAAAAA